MNRSLLRWPSLWAFLMLGSCGGGGSGDVVTLGTTPPSPPAVTALPPPGSFQAYSMLVTISVANSSATLFYDLERTPDPAINQAFQGQFTLRLYKNSRINVIVQDGDRTFGPYAFEYQISHPRPVGGYCAVSSFPKYWYRGGESVLASIEYQLPVSISKLAVVVDGKSTPLSLPFDSPEGTRLADLGPLPQGVHQIGCRVRSLDLPDINGETIALAVDSQAPTAGWLGGGGTFTHETWPAAFSLQTTDAESGVVTAKICDENQLRCMPMLHLAGGTYVYATVLTAETNTMANLVAVVSDLAGHSTVVAPLSIDLSAFAEPAPPAVTPITFTTRPVLNLPDFLGRPVSEVCFFDMSLPCPADPANIALAIGWNDFLFRGPGRTDWESFAIYHLGARVALPVVPEPWLVFSSEATAPLMQARRIDVMTSPGGEWERAWFDVPHLFFVRDRSVPPNSRWDEYDQVFTIATDAFVDRVQALQTPVIATAALLPLASTPATQVVTVSCPADCTASGNLYFERRATFYAYPLTHAALPAGFNTPTIIAAQADETCIFFWDENDDGAANGREPRSIQPCSTPGVVLQHRDGPLRWSYPLVMGVPYGGAVTRTKDVLSSGGAPLLTLPVSTTFDGDGNGQLDGVLSGPLPGVQTRFNFGIGSEVTSYTFDGGNPFNGAYSYQANVTDENGDALEALIQFNQSNFTNGVITNSFGDAFIGAVAAPGEMPYPHLFAMREGYLSVATAATEATVSLRLLSAAVTGMISGVVLDTAGQPVTNASITWNAPPYRSETLSRADGSYALPASGGSGSLSVWAFGTYPRTADYALDVTRMSIGQLVILPSESGEIWPMGLLDLFPTVTGTDLIDSLTSDRFYAAVVSGDASLRATSNGITRDITLPGALPMVIPLPGDVFAAPALNFLSELNGRGICGALSQPVLNSATVGNDCWNVIGDDGIQEFYFWRLTPGTGFPPLFGMGQFSATLIAEGTLPDPELIFHDMLLKRTIRLRLIGDQVFGYLPMGIYRVQTADGRWLQSNTDVIAEFAVDSNLPAPQLFILLAAN